jgi:hypothetical protein
MNIIKLSEFIKLAKHLDSVGKFKEADNLLIKISNYYPEQSQTKTKDISYFEWDETTEEQFKDNDTNYITKKPNLLQKEYYHIGEGTDPKKKDELNTQGLLNGPSGSGIAAYDPGNLASSPSMSGGVENFTWDEVYDENHPEYNRIPRR